MSRFRRTTRVSTAIALVIACVLPTSRPAQAVTLTFNEPDFEWLANDTGEANPYFIWTLDDYWRQNFANTGLSSASMLDLTLQIVGSGPVEPLNLSVQLNGQDVGSFVLTPDDLGLNEFHFSFPAISGDDYQVQVLATSTMAPGNGSYSVVLEGGSFAILQVPEPSTLAMLLAALPLGYVAYRRSP